MQTMIRDGVPADLPLVAAIKASSWDDTYRPLVGDAVVDQLLDVEDHRQAIQRDLEKREAFFLVAEAPNQQVVGFALSHLDEEGEPFLESLHVSPGLRGSGIGTDLFRATASRWATRGHDSMSLHVIAANSGARRFYERHGGVAAGTIADSWKGAAVTLMVYRWPSLGNLDGMHSLR